MKSSKKLILFLLVLSILFFTPQTDAQNNDLTQEYCVTISQCVPMNAGMTPQLCEDNNGIIITQQQYNQGACDSICCCLQFDSEVMPRAYCMEQYPNAGIEELDPGLTCEQICSATTPADRYNLTAEITGPDNQLIQLGEYTLYFADGQERTSGEFTNGQVTMTNLLPLQYTLRVQTDIHTNNILYECAKETQVQITDSNLEIAVQIQDQHCEQITDPEPPQPPLCTSVWIYEFTLSGCGNVTAVYDLNECDEPTSQPTYQVGDEVECIDLPGGLCGNNVLDEGEQCEVINNQTVYASGIQSCLDLNHDGGILRCSNCVIDESFCITCPEDPAGCFGNSQLCECAECQGTSLCTDEQECEEGTELTLTVNRVFQQVPGLRIDWQTSDLCMQGASVKIFERKCGLDEDSCNPINVLEDAESLPADNTPYIRTGFDPSDFNRLFCYKIELTAQNGVLLNSTPPPVCARLPHPLCIGKPDGTQFCHGNQRVECIGGLLHEMGGCDAGQQCINPANRPPFCVSPELCDACSGPYGVFGFLMYDQLDFQVDGYSCEDSEIENICFREDFAKTKSAFGRFNQCGEVRSCYDYVTQGSCERNACDMLGGEPSACEWTPYEQGELGFGVCKPTDADLQDCNACDKNAPGGFCSREMCALYGDCYYNENPEGDYAVDKYYCNNKHEVGCETFNTPQECHGGSTLNIDIQYQDFKPASGTHQIITPSQNELNRQICVWSEDKCIRDADFTTPLMPGLSDCRKNDKYCLLDFTPPVTNVTIRGEPIMSGGTYSTRQLYSQALQVLVSETARTRFSIIRENQLGNQDYEYPNRTFQNFAWHIHQNIHEGDGGNYVIAYYSKDLANNLELVQYKTLNLLTQLIININHEITHTEYYMSSGTVLTDIEIRINSPQDSYTCEGTLKNLKETIGLKRTKSTNNRNLLFEYALLEDGDYVFQAECYDEYFQRKNMNYTFTISEDNILSNPSPVMEALSNRTVTISIESESEADCEYIDRGNLNLGMHGQFTSKETLSDGRVRHKATITPPRDGVYIFQPACDFQDSNIGYYLGNAGDFISFGIDHSAPTLKVYDTAQGLPDTPVEYDASLNPEESLTLQFRCDDSQEILQYAGAFDFSFGCKDMHYRLEHTFPFQGITQLNETGMLESGDIKTFTAPDQFAIVNLKINVSDKGGNYQMHNIRLRLRSLQYESPTVEICNPETEICI